MLKRFLSYYKTDKKLFILDMLASFCASVLSIVYPVITRKMLNTFIPNKEYSNIIYAGLLVLGIYLIRAYLNYFVGYKGHMMGVHIQIKIREDMFKHLEQLPFSYYDNHETGKIMSRLTNDLQEVSELAHHGPENIIISLITIIISFAYLCTINVSLALVIFACVPILALVSLSFRRRHVETYRKTKAAVAIVNANLETAISGIRVTKAFNNQEKEEENFLKGQENYEEAYRHSYQTMGLYHSITTFINEFFNVVVLIAGGLFLYSGQIDFADYSAFIVSVSLFTKPIMTIIQFMEQFRSGAAGFERFCEIMDTPVEIDASKAVKVDKLDGKIEFKNVNYSYDNESEVLRDVSFTIEKGKKFALVGPSGGGKTTICHLIPHFYNIQDGDILIDDKSIDEITLGSLRGNIGIVQQDIYLFNASIKDNILYGRLDATFEEVVEAAKMANIHEYIMSLPHGYDTVIGERGVRLSGGQKQRLCIARVFLKNPPILILDEATSALDNATELLIQQSLDKLCEGRTTLIVAHRLSTIKNADEIAVVDEGVIKQQGTHEQLIEQEGMYQDLYKLQFRD